MKDFDMKLLVAIFAGASFGFWQQDFNAGVFMLQLLILVTQITEK